MPDTIQLTVAQPLVKFLGAQYSVVRSAGSMPGDLARTYNKHKATQKLFL
jgi:TPP-dependent trihydroxycyclohexane-1,2-dione (THcHDO) dehydratase